MMRGNDKTRDNVTFRLVDLRVAFALLTRLPLPYPPINPDRPAARAAWAYPLVGIAVAAITVAIIAIASGLGLPPAIAALCALGASIVVTGAMHEDGLADCADGFWGGWTPERRLEIMKDSQIGTYGVLALVLTLGLRWQAIAELINLQSVLLLLPPAVLSRSAMVMMMYMLPHARETGLSHQTGRPDKTSFAVALALGILAVLFTGKAGIITLLIVGIVTLALSKLAQAKIGGQTGDVLGATQQITEVTILLVYLATVHIP